MVANDPVEPDTEGEGMRRVDARWDSGPRPRRGPKPALSVEQITHAALAIADREGIEKVSMARVAGALGFTTMSLYRYVASKAELIDLVVDTAVGLAPELGATPGGWRGDLERWALHCWDTFAHHPWLVLATARSSRVMGPHELGWLESALATLTATGLDGADAHDAVLLVLGHVRSVAQFSRTDHERGAEFAGITDDLVRQYKDRYPALAASTAAGAMQRQDRDRLDFGLRCILDGLERLIADQDSDDPDQRTCKDPLVG